MLDRDVMIALVTTFRTALPHDELGSALVNVLRMGNLEGLSAGTPEAVAAIDGALSEAIDNGAGQEIFAQLSRSVR